MKFGDFASLCKNSPLPVCILFRDKAVPYQDGGNPSCVVHLYNAGSAKIINLSKLCISALVTVKNHSILIMHIC